ncbi:protein RALF-like 4 [Cornus florida]|uniref:protein RALF-like 4 n=1 Tax=Cornus florida TaxID=4283 RepID=UPI002897CFB0|nr:protein RALF-like 4 [Cornus florida]
MSFRPWLILLLLATATTMSMSMSMSESSFRFNDANFDLETLNSLGVKACINGRVGDCIDKAEELLMDSESSRRLLAGGPGYISYDALKANNVPCDKRGPSYYNCNQQGPVNPYNRGCSVISKCARYTN